MKVLVTGGAGFIGSHIVDALVEDGHNVVIVDDLSRGSEDNLNPKATFYSQDIRDGTLYTVFEGERPEAVFHYAAQSSVSVSTRRPVLDAEVNILGSLNLLHCCAIYGVRRFVYAASGGTLAGAARYSPIDEEHPKSPRSPYGVSKLTVEYYLDVFAATHGLSGITLRYGNVYGPRQDPYGEAGVIAIFTGQMLRGEPVTVHHTGEQEKDYVYVGDVVAANLIALSSSATGAYNIASGKATSVNELYRHLAELTGYRQAPLHGPQREGDVEFCLDIRKAEAELGWRPTVGLEEGLRRTVEFYRAEQDASRSS